MCTFPSEIHIYKYGVPAKHTSRKSCRFGMVDPIESLNFSVWDGFDLSNFSMLQELAFMPLEEKKFSEQ